MNRKVSYHDNSKRKDVIPLHTATTSMALREYDVAVGSSGGVGSKKGATASVLESWFGCKTWNVQQTKVACMRCKWTVTTKRGNNFLPPLQAESPGWVRRDFNSYVISKLSRRATLARHWSDGRCTLYFFYFDINTIAEMAVKYAANILGPHCLSRILSPIVINLLWGLSEKTMDANVLMGIVHFLCASCQIISHVFKISLQHE